MRSILNGDQWTVVGGTSVASPLWAAFTALANQQRAKYGEQLVGFANPLIYRDRQEHDLPAGFHDINDNSTNLFYHATAWLRQRDRLGVVQRRGPAPAVRPRPEHQARGAIAFALTLTPNPVVGGLAVTGTVTLANPAPAGGATVTLASTRRRGRARPG